MTEEEVNKDLRELEHSVYKNENSNNDNDNIGKRLDTNGIVSIAKSTIKGNKNKRKLNNSKTDNESDSLHETINQFEHQIHSQLQDQLNDSINETFVVKNSHNENQGDNLDGVSLHSTSNDIRLDAGAKDKDVISSNDNDNVENSHIIDGINNGSNDNQDEDTHKTILDATNIDDELRKLGNIDMQNIHSTVDNVDIAAAAVASFARATLSHADNDENNDNGDNNTQGLESHTQIENVHDDVVDDDDIGDIAKHIDVDINVSGVDVDDVEVDADVMADIVKHASMSTTIAGENLPDSNITSLDNTDMDSKPKTELKETFNKRVNKQNKMNQLLKDKLFYLPSDFEENQTVKEMIIACGGSISATSNPDSITLVPSKNDSIGDSITQYTYSYIYDTFTKQASLNMKKYKLPSAKSKANQELKISIGNFPISRSSGYQHNDISHGGVTQSITDIKINNTHSLSKRKSNKFTEEEDEYILDLVRRNPHLRSTHTFFARIAQLPPLSEHTGNSIRYRYRKILAPKLTYVYKLDPETGEPLINPETNEVMKITEIPSLIKSQYTSDEDYALCKHIWAYKNGEITITSNKRVEVSQIPEYVFQKLHESNPRHSAMSWRDRYRKFAAKFGLKRYITYYEDCQSKNIPAEPMKNMSSRADRRDYKVDVFENENISKRQNSNTEEKNVKRVKPSNGDGKTKNRSKIDDVDSKSKIAEEFVPNTNDKIDPTRSLESSLYENKNANSNPALSTLANISTTQRKINDKKALKSKNDASNTKTTSTKTDNLIGSKPINNNLRSIKESEAKPSKNKRTIDKTGNDIIDEDANLFVSATVDEMKQYNISLDENRKIDNLSESTGSNPILSANEHIEPVNEEGDDQNNNENGNQDDDVDMINAKADDGLMDFRQLIDIDPEPLKHRDSIDLPSMIESIRECFRNFGDNSTPYELFKDISDQTGISMLWLNYWFDCSCGMLGTFIQAIIHYLKTGELIMNNVSGFWTEKDDELLKVDPDNKPLLELHGKDSVTKRKAVLFSYLV